MDFFERQANARRHTKLLEVYFVLAVIGTVLMVYLITVVALTFNGYRSSLRYHSHQPVGFQDRLLDPRLFLEVSAVTVGFILCGSAYKTMELSGGGSVVAEMLGGRAIDANTRDPDERKLLDVVEEMAIASGTQVPHVYVMDDERGINAFAAGHSTSDMVICATGGAIKRLKRDELQGVIGHEFSHILNGDMRMNLRLMGLVFGILCLALFGRGLMQVGSYRTGSRGNNAQFALLIGGLMLLCIGSIGVFFAKLIKSAISRQREVLADASSVQFTRNPSGLANALKKVGGCGSRIDDANAEDASHFFFANGMTESFSSMFSTHPPLEERIKLLEPDWDGKFITTEMPDSPEERQRTQVWQSMVGQPRTVRPPQMGDLLGGRAMGPAMAPMTAGAAAAILAAGTPTQRHLDYAADLRNNLPPALLAAAREPMTAVALIYALLLSADDAARTIQMELLEKQTAQGMDAEIQRLQPEVARLDSRARLPLASLAMTALRRLSAPQYVEFSAAIGGIIAGDKEMGLFEYALQKIVLRQLEPNFRPVKKPVVQYYALKPLVPACAVLLSAVAYAGQSEADAAQQAFRKGAAQLNAPDLQLLASADCTLAKVDVALNDLNQGAPQLKKLVLLACAETIVADGVIKEDEAELLRAIADTLDCPIPPIVTL
jgi:Zn-dependent protease with chaperone function